LRDKDKRLLSLSKWKKKKKPRDKLNLRKIKTEGRKSIERTNKGKSEKHGCRGNERIVRLNLAKKKKIGSCS
jgi:hypothetical protein